MIKRRSARLAFIVGASVSWSTLAVAQEAASPAATGDGEILVTARRTEERIQDVPVAVTAFSGDLLAKRNITDVRSLGTIAPGLTVAEANSPATLIITLRGLANVNPNTGSDATVGYYFNEVPINMQNGSNLSLFDISNVQVLKGPQGTLFGRNATGGALLINANKPTDKVEGYAQLGGTFFRVGHGVQAEGVLNLPLSPTLSLRLAGRVVDREGFVRNVLPRNVDPGAYGTIPLPFGKTDFQNLLGEKSQAWRIGLRWKPSDTVENLTYYDGAHFQGDGLPTFSTALNPAGPIVNFAPFLGFPDPAAAYAALNAARKDYFWSTMLIGKTPLTVKAHSVSNTTTVDLNDSLTLKNIIGYRHVSEEYAQDITGLPGAYFMYRSLSHGYNLTEELQLQGKSFDDRLKWTVGGFYFQEDRSWNTDRTVQFGGIGGTTQYRSKAHSYSIFGQGSYHLTDALSLTLGARYNIDRRQARLVRFTPDINGNFATCGLTGGTPANCALDGERTFHAFSYNVSLDYKVDPQTLVYFATRRGYRSGGYSATQSTLTGGYLAFEPEYLTDYEIGLKRDWALGGDVRLRTNLALFYDNYKNIQRLAVAPNDFTNQIIINAPKATVKGGELELTLNLGRNVQIGYSYALADPTYKNFVVGGVDYSGNTFAYASHDNHSVTALITVPLEGNKGEVVLSGDWHYQTKQYYDGLIQTTTTGGGSYPANTLAFGGFGIANLKVSWNRVLGSAFDVSAFVKNLTDTKILPNGTPNTYPTLGNGIGFYSQPPRMFGLDVRYNF